MKPTLLYCTPTAGYPRVDYITSVMAITRTAKAFRDITYAIHRGLFPIARDSLARKALHGFEDAQGNHQDFDFIAMHDDDLDVQAINTDHGNILDYYLSIMDASPDVGMVGAVYLESGPVLPCVRAVHPKYAEFPPQLCRVVRDFPRSPFEVGGIGTGFVLIRMEAIRSLCKLDPGPVFRCQVYPRRWGPPTDTTEDVDFCHRLNHAGWKIVADPLYNTTHVKEGLHNKDLRWNYDEFHQRKAIDLRPLAPPETDRTIRIGDMLCMDPVPPEAT